MVLYFNEKYHGDLLSRRFLGLHGLCEGCKRCSMDWDWKRIWSE